MEKKRRKDSDGPEKKSVKKDASSGGIVKMKQVRPEKTDGDKGRKAPGQAVKGRKFEDTHMTILEKTLELFAKKGFKASTTREIALNAGITEVTLFRHFSSKEALFEEMLQKFTLLPFLTVAIEQFGHLPIEKKLMFLMDKFFEIFKMRSSIFKIIVGEAVYNPEIAKLFFENAPLKGMRMMAELLSSNAADTARFRKINPRIAVRAFAGMIISYNILQEILGGKNYEKFDEDEVKKTFLDIFLNGVLERGEKK